MSIAVLISIWPKWCELIAKGKKTIEIRKTRPKLETPFKCYIYCTLSGSNEFFRETLGGDVAAWNRSRMAEKKGMVIGEFVCDEISRYASVGIRREKTSYRRFNGLTFSSEISYPAIGLTETELAEYGGGKTIFGWHISKLIIYKEPRELGKYTGLHKTKFGFAPHQLQRPPQSWCYMEESGERAKAGRE